MVAFISARGGSIGIPQKEEQYSSETVNHFFRKQ